MKKSIILISYIIILCSCSKKEDEPCDCVYNEILELYLNNCENDFSNFVDDWEYEASPEQINFLKKGCEHKN